MNSRMKTNLDALKRSRRILRSRRREQEEELAKLRRALMFESTYVHLLKSESSRLARTRELLGLQFREQSARVEQVKSILQHQIFKRAQSAQDLEESNGRYHTLADAVALLIWQSRPDGQCTYFNKGWLEFTGRALDQELGNGWAKGVHPEDVQRCLDGYRSALERRAPLVIEYRLRHHSGEYRWVLDRGAPVCCGGVFQGYIGACIDIHDRKLAEEALKKSRAELRTLAGRLQAVREEERAELARELHDELSGTLTALKMELSLLPDRAAEDRDAFLQKLGSMNELIDRSMARVHGIVTGLRPVVLDKFGLVAAIEWQAGQFQDLSGIVCDCRLPAGDSSLDSKRSTAVFRILQEALTNVARHSGATRVAIEFKSEAESVLLAVRDNGKGIDENVLAAPNSLGLLGMRERAQVFGGAMEVRALPEGGTCVTVRIPTPTGPRPRNFERPEKKKRELPR